MRRRLQMRYARADISTVGDECMKLKAALAELRNLLGKPRPAGGQYHGRLERLRSNLHRRANLTVLADPPDAEDVGA